MTGLDATMHFLGVLVLTAPALLMAVLGLLALFGARLGERFVSRLTLSFISFALLSAVGVLGLMLRLGEVHFTVKLADWVAIPGYHFVFKLVFDRLSVAFVILSLAISGVIGSFSTRYLHKDPGFTRYFVFYAVFVLGMTLASLAGTIETLFAGWELVGLSSALLVGFFYERPAPSRNGLWVWIVYRVADAALLLAAIALHHMEGGGDFGKLMDVGRWPGGDLKIPAGQALLVGLLLLVAAAGKSGLVPFSGWLPRAMEGPTTSSAVYYGALSVHLGAFLLLRLGPLLAASPALAVAVVVLGLLTAALASLSGSVQTDIKSALAFASLAQVGIIVAEIGFGFRWLPLVHLIGHACLRTLQFLRAPSLLEDMQRLENAVGGRLAGPIAGRLPTGAQAWLYRAGLERGWLDEVLRDWVARPTMRLFENLDKLDRAWAGFLSGGQTAKKEEQR